MNLLRAGAPLETAQTAVILLHGRGSSARDTLSLATELELPGVAFLAPEAVNGSWYPLRFLEPQARNEPFLSQALETVRGAMQQTGLEQQKIALLGFSQGACLALETAHRTGGRFKAVIGLSGGLIGVDSELGLQARPSLESTPIFLGCSDIDPHIPIGRVRRSAVVLEMQGGNVETRIYPNFGHGVNGDELGVVRSLLSAP